MEQPEAWEAREAPMSRATTPDPQADELPVLPRVRPARWSEADAAAYEGARGLLDEAIEECADREATALAAAVPDRREAAKWRNAALELQASRARLRPDRRAAVRQVRDRCLAVLDQAVSLTRIRTALASGRARALEPEAGQVRCDGAWWVRADLGYVPAPLELTSLLDAYAQTLAAADAAVSATGARASDVAGAQDGEVA
jgi:hypothetical protein